MTVRHRNPNRRIAPLRSPSIAVPDDRLPPVEKRIRMFVTLAIIGLVGLVAGYAFFVLTKVGQRIDDAAYLGRAAEGSRVANRFHELLNVIEPGTILLSLIVLVVIGVARRELAVALWASGGFILAVVIAEILKHVLPRPALDLEYGPAIGMVDSYPSGHTTIATSFTLALLIVTAPRLRALVQVIGTFFVAAVASGVVIAGWHRPSDALGGLALSLMVMAALAAYLTHARGHEIEPSASSVRGPWEVAGIIVVLVAAFAWSLRQSYHEKTVFYLLVFGTINLVVLGFLVSGFAWTLRRVDWTLRQSD